MSAQPKGDYPTDGAGDGANVVHQALRREVNENINALNHDFRVADAEFFDVMCECAHVSCSERVSMTAASYEVLRRFPTHFVVKAGHEVVEGERIVSEAAEYIVVEKNGHEGLYAVSSDPRRRRRLSDAEVGA